LRQFRVTGVIKVTDLADKSGLLPNRYGKIWDCLLSERETYRRRLRQIMPLDETTRTELEAAAFRTLVQHLRTRTDVQNVDLMNLAGFCRNCLSNWLKDAADARGVPLSKDESREAVYGMPYDEWKARHQKEASADQLAKMAKAHPGH
jgi:hypothetical protein